MAKTQLLDYYIHLTDKSQVDTYNDQLATGGPGVTQSPGGVGSPIIYAPHSPYRYGILRAPEGAAVEFSAPIQNEDVNFSAPSTRSPWFIPSTNNFPRNVATFTRKSGGWFGIASLFGSTTKFHWVGHFVFSQPTTNPVTGDDTVVTTPADIPERIAIAGFECASARFEGQVNGSTTSPRHTNNAARHPGDRGFAYRQEGSGTQHANFDAANYATDVFQAWERFYLTINRLGTAEVGIWRFRQFAQTGEGFSLAVTASGQLAFYFNADDTAGGRELLGTASALAVGTPVKVDIIWGVLGQAAPVLRIGNFEVYVNNARIGGFSRNLLGVVGNIRWAQSCLGKRWTSTTDAEINFDNWVVAHPPVNRKPLPTVWSSAAVAYVVGDIRYYDGIPTSVGLGGLQFGSVTNGSGGNNTGTYKCIANHVSNDSTNIPTNTALWVRVGDSLDWLAGSRIVHVRASGDGPDRANFTGAWQIALQNPADDNTFQDQLTSVTTGAIMEVTCDVSRVNKIYGQRGIVAAATTYYGSKAGVGGSSGTLGMTLNGVPLTGFALAEASTQAANGALLYHPIGLQAGVTLSSLNVRITLGTAAGTAGVRHLGAVVEVIGIFGKEDVPAGTVDVPPFPTFHSGIHNRNVPRSPWALSASRAIAPMVIHTGTFVGNGVETVLTFRVPPHMIFIRRITGANDLQLKWFAGMLAAHSDDEEGVRPQGIPIVEIDPTFVPVGGEDDQAQRYRARITGSNANWNQNTVTYAYVAICDPGARFSLTGAIADDSVGTTPQNHVLGESEFTPEAGFFWPETNTSTATGQAAFKGPGLAADEAAELPGTQRTSYAKFNAGSIDYHKGATGMIEDGDIDQVGYMLFRRNDGNGTAEKAFALVTWVGDGAASKVINTGFITGLRPVWAWVSGSGGSSFFRDASHTGTNSTNISTGTQGATGITAGGPDQITVGSLLNASGVTYTGIVFMGSATAGNNGWSIDGEFIPIEPDYIKDAAWVEPLQIDVSFAGGGGGGVSATPDLDTAATASSTDLGGIGPLGSAGVSEGGMQGGQPCEFYTRILLNNALGRIGQSKIIANVVTDNTEEAAHARQFVLEEVNQVLRDHPWPFATRYSTLVLVGGTPTVPVNNDWHYSYRTPSGCMFARRIAKAGNFRAFDPSPIRFRRSSDSTGGLIFCDVETSVTVPLVLEWTARITCPSFYGDAMFRDALTWRFAAAFAMALAKDSEKQKFCLDMYRAVLHSAEVDAQNEQQPQPAPLAEGDADWIRHRDIIANVDPWNRN